MLKNTLLLLYIPFFVLTGCGTSNITYNPKQLSISMDEKYFSFPATLLREHTENYNNLYVKQRLLRLKDGSLIIHEQAKTDELFEFENTVSWITSSVFETKKIYSVYANSHLYAYQLLLSNNKILNIIVQQDDTQAVNFLYGMSTKRLNQILERFDNYVAKAYYDSVITIDSNVHDTWSKWSVRKIHFLPLIVPLRQAGGAGG